jgi:hypothetical protein
MSTATRVGAFLATLALVFALALGAGRAFGPAEAPATVAAHEMPEAAMKAAPGGLMISQDGYALALAEQRVSPGRSVPVAFTVTGPDGRPVTSYDVEHERRLHLIAVRRDLTGFQHVHPELSRDGVWTSTLDLSAGQWRLFADFTPSGGDALTLGADLAVKGDYRPVVQPGESRTARFDGYVVTVAGDLHAGADADLRLSVRRNAEPVTDLQPYLGAYGHLVALRSGDLAYLHVHPAGSPEDGTTKPGPDVEFHADVPSAGTYHLFLDFLHRGVVRTASFVLPAGGRR